VWASGKRDGKMLQETFLCLVADRDESRTRMATKIASSRYNLSIQFDRLLPSGSPNASNSEVRR